ncbi:hypothetical protein ACWCQ0_51920, partial [Streptomyces massasporeus]
MSLLPWVDEHVVVVDAGVDEVWARLLVKVGRSLSTAGGARYARVVGAVPRETGGVRPLGVGSEFPGFRVARLVPGRELALEGRHRFSSYSLVFRVVALRVALLLDGLLVRVRVLLLVAVRVGVLRLLVRVRVGLLLDLLVAGVRVGLLHLLVGRVRVGLGLGLLL